MEFTIGSRLKHAYNAFKNNRDSPRRIYYGASTGAKPDRPRLNPGKERSIVNSIINRIAVDAASIKIQHVRLDSDGRYSETIQSGLNYCLNEEANIDQTGREMLHDAYLSLLDEGYIAMVPVETDCDLDALNVEDDGKFEIYSMRIGQILEWMPRHVRVLLYNDQNGQKEEVIVRKETTVIAENPFYSVMNERNSTLQRLIRKLNLLDAVDEQSSSGKLDLIIQLPYVVKTDARRQQADRRRKDIEEQLSGSKYGIAYTDGTERITQLNRPVENNLMKQVEYLTSMLMSQLGMTQGILDGTADEKAMTSYDNRIVEPIVSELVDNIRIRFVSRQARKDGESVMFFRDPFRLVPPSQLPNMGDKLTRNEIASSNEMRQIIGWKPSSDPRADELRNKNLSEPKNSSSARTEENQNET